MIEPSLHPLKQQLDVSDQLAALKVEVAHLRLQNHFLRSVVNEMTSGVIVADAQPDYPITFVNRAFCTITGYAPEEVLGRHCLFLQGPGTDQVAVIRVREAIAAARPVHERLLNYRKDGHPFWNQIAISPVRDDQGRVTAFISLQTDVTTQVLVEQALAEREQLLRAVSKMAQIGGWEFDLVTQRMVWSEEMFAIHELPIGDSPALDVALWFYPPEVHHLVHEAFERCLATGAEWDIELPFRTARGQSRWVRSIGQPVWENGQIRKLRGMFQDITRSKENELALRASEQRYRMLANMLPGTVVFMFDTGLRLTLVAGADLKRLGINAARFEGQCLTDLFDEPHRSALLPLCYQALLGQSSRIDYTFRGEIFDTSIIPIERASDQISGGLIVGRNITAERQITADLLRAKEAAERTERAQAAFLSAISHEMRTPLNAVIASTELLLTDTLTPSQRSLIETIRIGGEALLALVNNVLDLSKIEAGRVEIAAEPTDVRAIVDAVLNLFKREADQKGLLIEAVIDPHLPALIVSDPARLRQMLMSLVSNAIKFTDRGGVLITVSVVVGIATDRSQVEIAVRDTGTGISAQQCSRLFQPFNHVDNDQTRQSGAGLGLAISAQLAHLMGGELTVAGQLGQGSTFTVTLPLQPVAYSPPVTAGQSVASGQSAVLRVLVAEDNEINQQVVLRLLQALGHQVTIVANGVEAVQKVQQQSFDVILMDIQMPEMDGEEATRRMRALGNQIQQPRIIALTAYALADVRERCLAAGMDGFLTKPVRLQDLHNALSTTPMPSQPSTVNTWQSDPVIDWTVFGELLTALGDQQPEIVTRTLALIQHEFQRQLDQLRVSIGCGDVEQVQRLAHRLKGSARQIGAVRVAHAAKALEHAATARMQLEPLFDALQYVVTETLRLFAESQSRHENHR
ncbi:MAG: PAS domain-containing protein [Chloroflexus sp.]|uniref:PAS domain-containing protein n=1 Tax=Chloroflexus sp. TaxID=1904827 RepID=UPI0040490919